MQIKLKNYKYNCNNGALINAIAFHYHLYKIRQSKTEFVTSRSELARLQVTLF